MRPHRSVLRSGFVLSLLAFWLLSLASAYLSLTYRATGSRHPAYLVGFDTNGYYAYARSLWFDHDLDFRNDYRYIVETQTGGTKEIYQQALKTPENTFNAGTGLAAIPAVMVAELLDAMWAAVTSTPRSSPFAGIYCFAYLAANITYGVLALGLCWNMTRRYFGRSAATTAVWAALLCGPMIYYFLYDPGMSHLTGAFFGAAAVVAWIRWLEARRAASAYRWATLAGLCLGFATCVRPYNFPLVILPALPVAVAGARALGFRLARAGRMPPGNVILATALAAAGAVAGVFPQLLAWKGQYGTWLANPQTYQFSFLPPHFFHVLFSPRHGLFYWAPAFLVAVTAVGIRARYRLLPAGGLLLVFLGVTFMYGNWKVYWLGVSFGMRGYIDLIYLFAFGFGAIGFWLRRRLGRQAGRNVGRQLVVLFALINLHLLIAFQSGSIWVDGPLHWLETVSNGARYKAFLRKEAARWSDFGRGRRVSLRDSRALVASGGAHTSAGGEEGPRK